MDRIGVDDLKFSVSVSDAMLHDYAFARSFVLYRGWVFVLGCCSKRRMVGSWFIGSYELHLQWRSRGLMFVEERLV